MPRSIVEAQLGHTGQTTYERHCRDVARAPERYLFADVFEQDADPSLSPATAEPTTRALLQLDLFPAG